MYILLRRYLADGSCSPLHLNLPQHLSCHSSVDVCRCRFHVTYLPHSSQRHSLRSPLSLRPHRVVSGILLLRLFKVVLVSSPKHLMDMRITHRPAAMTLAMQTPHTPSQYASRSPSIPKDRKCHANLTASTKEIQLNQMTKTAAIEMPRRE